MKEIVVTPGCPSGVGPELITKALGQVSGPLRVFWSGGPKLLQRSAEISQTRISQSSSHYFCLSRDVEIICSEGEEALLPLPGSPTQVGLEMQKRFLLEGISVAKSRNLKALLTGPVRKNALYNIDGRNYPGQTELLASHFAIDSHPALMCFSGLPFILGLASVHIALKDVSTALTSVSLANALSRLLEAAGWYFNLPRSQVRMAVLGINPHASENGLMGHEEQDLIIPAVEHLTRTGMQITGPLAADGFFGNYRHLNAEQMPHAVLAMYHDQGLAPYKALCAESVNFTWGLSLLRTSPGHGTADNLAGKNSASVDPTIKALELALRFAELPRESQR